MLTDVGGVRVGHWTDPVARTGCTVVLLPAGTVASGEVRGGAPGTREWALLDPSRLVARVDAVVLAGGSAFGLAACDGVVRWCEERGIGLPTAGGTVPIVVGAVLYDLAVGEPAHPDAGAGYAACEAAVATGHAVGPVGAGTGATVAKWRGPAHGRPGGIGAASVRGPGGLVVAALVACNAWGEPRPPGGASPPVWDEPVWDAGPVATPAGAPVNTTIGVVVTNARLDKAACLLLAQSGHDGLARALEPVHAVVDGDALVAAATGQVDPPATPTGLEVVRAMAAAAVEQATRAAVPDGPAVPDDPGGVGR